MSINKSKFRSIVRSIIFHSLVDRTVHVTTHPDPTVKEVKGKIIKDTANTIVLRSSDKIKQLEKSGVFTFKIQSKMIKINANLLRGRIKKRRKQKLRTW